MARRSRASRVASSGPATPAPVPIKTIVAPVGFDRSALGELVGALLLILVTLVVYLPALHGGLIMDDTRHITQPELRSLHGLWRTWFVPGATSQYYPLLHSAFWVEYRMWGDSVFGYHLVNVLFHGISACVVVMIVRRLALPGAWLAGFIFAVHPVCVNSVAWIAEQKSTLSAVFYLAAALTYLHFDQTRRRWQYFVALALFVLALLSKTVTATLPAALLVVFWWRRGRLDLKRDVRPLLPWIAVGLGAGIFTAWVEREFVGAEGPDFALSLLDRFLIAGRVIWFYFAKLVWPVNLMFIYPHWKIDAAVWWQYLFPLGVVAIALALLRFAKHSRGPLAALLFFVGTLVPVLGFLNVYPFMFSYVSDHFQYLAMLGVIVPLASGWGSHLRVSPYFSVRVIVILAVLTWREAKLYKDPVALYSDNLNRNPDAWVAHHNLGVAILDQPGQLPAAISHFEAALQIKPDAAEVHHDLAGALLKMPGRLPDAISELQTVVHMKPESPVAHDDLGRELAKLPGQLPQAIAEFNAALQLDPNYAEAHADLGVGLLRIPDRLPEAIAHLKTALRLNPDLAVARNGLGSALASSGRWPEAVEQFEAAIQIHPSPETHTNLGTALMNLGRLPDAAAQFEAALRLNPGDVAAHMGLGNCFFRSRRWTEAVREYETVLGIAPNDAEAEDNLGVTLMEIPDRSREAMHHFEIALQNDPNLAEAHLNLAINLANAGRTAEAIHHFEIALRIRPDFAEAHFYFGVLLSKIPGRTPDAVTHLEAALRIKPDPETRRLLDNLRAARR
ncbi:MAG: tetratricopeptide repeat protein [Bryobacteraceae bacterium]